MRVDELVLKVQGEELRVKFHPRMTVLSGLGADERRSLADSVLGSITGGPEATALHYVDGTGRTVTLETGGGGSVQARHDDDGSAAKSPVGHLAGSPETLRALMLVQADDLSVVTRGRREDEPRELREARDSLEEITEQLQAALGESQGAAALQKELDELDETLRTAHEDAHRREYAEVLARLERVRAEAATLQSGSGGADADRHLLSHGDATRALAATWIEAADALTLVLDRFGATPRLAAADLPRAAALPEASPPELHALVDALADALANRDELDRRLQALAVAKLPAPSDLVVGELGLLEQGPLWRTADRLLAATDEVQRIQMSLGGLRGDEGGEDPVAITEMEAAHRDLEDAEQAAEAVRVPGVAGTALGVTIMLAGAIGAPLLIPLGILIGASVGTVTLVLPKSRVAKAAAIERAALDRAGVPSYLGFHLRRVDAAVDPNVRGTVESASNEMRAATAAWMELVGEDIDVRHAVELRAEVLEYNAALRNLGGAADEIEQLRKELADQAEPAVLDARRRPRDGVRALWDRGGRPRRSAAASARRSPRRSSGAREHGRRSSWRPPRARSARPPSGSATSCGSSGSTPGSSTPASAPSTGRSPVRPSARRLAPTPAPRRRSMPSWRRSRRPLVSCVGRSGPR